MNFRKQQRDGFDVENRAHVDDPELNNFKIIKDQFAVILARLIRSSERSASSASDKSEFSDASYGDHQLDSVSRRSTSLNLKFEFEIILLETREASK